MRIYITPKDFDFHAINFDVCPNKHIFHYMRNKQDLTKKILISNLKEFNPDGIIAGLEIYDKDVLEYCPNLKVISRVGSGYDNIDIDEITERGIALCTTVKEPVQAVAEFTIAQMINLLRNIPEYTVEDRIELQSVGGFQNHKYLGKCVSDCTVGIIGVGNIGSRVATILDVIGARTFKYDTLKHRCNHDLETVLTESDIITLHIPLNDENKGFIDIKKLKLMKPTAYLINTSRGGIIDEDALYDALLKNTIAGAALDVFTEEPYYGKLRYFKNVYYTPHIGSYTEKTRKDMEIKALLNCVDYLINN